MSYNINYGIGPDGNYDLTELAEVIASGEAGIVGLNEVDYRFYRTDFRRQIKFLATYLDMNYAYGPNLKTGWGSYGNALLSEYPIIKVNNIRLPGRLFKEPRGLLRSTLLLPDGSHLHVLITHLSTDSDMREKQLVFLGEIISGFSHPFLIMGDFNDEINKLSELKPAGDNTVKSFPSYAPTYAIDLIFTSEDLRAGQMRTIDSEASDHLPVITEITGTIS